MAGKRYMTVNEVAERFGVDPETVRNWWKSNLSCLQGWQPHHTIGKRGLRFTVESVEEFERTGMVGPECGR